MRWILAAAILTSTSCKITTVSTTYKSISPDSASQLLVQETGCVDSKCGIQVTVKQGWRTEQVATRDDCALNFAHSEWSRDLVAVFVDGGTCGDIKVAYNLKTHRQVDFKSAAPWLGASIIKAYGVSDAELAQNAGDVFLWAKYPGDGNPRRSREEFRKRFPGL